MTTPASTTAKTPATTTKKPRTSPRDLSKDVPGLELNAQLVEPGKDWTRPTRTVTRSAKPRSAQQKKLDGQAVDLYTRWTKTPGRPRDMEKSPKAEYLVSPEHVDVLTALARKTVGPGGPVEIRNKSVKIRQATHKSGKVAVTIAVWDRTES